MGKMFIGSQEVAPVLSIASGDYEEKINKTTIVDATSTDIQYPSAKAVYDRTVPFVGATTAADGKEGTVPAPLAGDENKFLKADGTWDVPPGSVAPDDVTIKVNSNNKLEAQQMIGASTVDGERGLVPKPLTTDKDKFLKGDGTWATVSGNDPDDVTIKLNANNKLEAQVMTGASTTNGAKGLVPQPLIADKDKFLKGDGTWATVSGSAMFDRTGTGVRIREIPGGGSIPDPRYEEREYAIINHGFKRNVQQLKLPRMYHVLEFDSIVACYELNGYSGPAPSVSDRYELALLLSSQESTYVVYEDNTFKLDQIQGGVRSPITRSYTGPLTGSFKYTYADKHNRIIYNDTIMLQVDQTQVTPYPYNVIDSFIPIGMLGEHSTDPELSKVIFKYLECKITDGTSFKIVPAYDTYNAVNGFYLINSDGTGGFQTDIPSAFITLGPATSPQPPGKVLEGVPFTGATATTKGVYGDVPEPQAGDQDKFLKGDGTWATVSGNDPDNVTIKLNSNNKLEAQVMTGASTTNGAKGLVPQPLIADKGKFLKGDGSWAEVQTMIGASTTNGQKGLVPQPLVADKDKFLKGDGTWATVSGGGGLFDRTGTGVTIDEGTTGEAKIDDLVKYTEYEYLQYISSSSPGYINLVTLSDTNPAISFDFIFDYSQMPTSTTTQVCFLRSYYSGYQDANVYYQNGFFYIGKNKICESGTGKYILTVKIRTEVGSGGGWETVELYKDGTLLSSFYTDILHKDIGLILNRYVFIKRGWIESRNRDILKYICIAKRKSDGYPCFYINGDKTFIGIANYSSLNFGPECIARTEKVLKGVPFVGATATTRGIYGDVPEPQAGDNTKFLKGNGTWTNVSILTVNTEADLPSPSTLEEGTMCYIKSTKTYKIATTGSYTNAASVWEDALSYTVEERTKLSAIEPGAQVNPTAYSTTGQNTDGYMTQKAVTDALAAVGGFKVVLLDALPTTGEGGTIYLIKAFRTDGSEFRKEYLWVEGTPGYFEQIGDTEVSVNDMTGATATADGVHGLAPKPVAGDQDKFLKGDGTWGLASVVEVVELI